MMRIMVAAKHTTKAPRQQTKPDAELADIELPAPGSMSRPGDDPTGAAGANPPGEATSPAAPLPSTGAELNQSGLDMGTVMQGGDAFDALTKGIGK